MITIDRVPYTSEYYIVTLGYANELVHRSEVNGLLEWSCQLACHIKRLNKTCLFKLPFGIPADCSAKVPHLVTSPDCTVLIAEQDGKLVKYDLNAGTFAELQLDEETKGGTSESVQVTKGTEDGKLLYGIVTKNTPVSHPTIRLWNSSTLQVVSSIDPGIASLESLQAARLSRDGSKLAVRTGDSQVQLYDTATGHAESLTLPTGVTFYGDHFAFSNDGRTLAMMGRKPGKTSQSSQPLSGDMPPSKLGSIVLVVWDLAESRMKRVFSARLQGCEKDYFAQPLPNDQVAWSPDGKKHRHCGTRQVSPCLGYRTQ